MKKIISLAVVLIMFVASYTYATDGNMGNHDGYVPDGSESSPWLIEDLADFEKFCNTTSYWTTDMNTNLTTNLDLSGMGIYSKSPIASDTNGTFAFNGTAFDGIFNGNGHVISNLAVSGAYYCGLFGKIGYGGVITSLGLENAVITGAGNEIGGLVGLNNGCISNCYATGSVTGGSEGYVGGLCGSNYGNISSSYATGVVNGTGYYTGGLAGYNYGNISSSYATGSVANSSDYTGGLVGSGSNYGSITSCYATGSVAGSGENSYFVGGLSGFNNSGSIISCYATGKVIGTVMVGGLVGCNSNISSNISNCYATGIVVGTEHVGGLTGWNDRNISNCYATGDVSGNNHSFGGLVGTNYKHGTISSSYATGHVVITGNYVGGLVGWNYNNINNCYATGDVSGNEISGGLVGINYNNYGTISNSYATGSVSSTGSYKGGLIGYYDSGSITGCFWDTQTTGMDIGLGLGTSTGVTGKTTSEMQTISTFTTTNWDFSIIDGDAADWQIRSNSYPRLNWQVVSGDIAGSWGVGIADLEILTENWLEEGSICDLDGSGQVDMKDFAKMAANWLVSN